MPTIAIIGAGFSGTLLALQLQRRCPRGTAITLIERAPVFGLGLAYATASSSHLLNVRAGGMSAFRDQPDHFLQWLNHSEHRWGEARVDAHAFVPRHVFGAYLRALLSEAVKRGADLASLSLVPGEVTACAMHMGNPVLTLNNGREMLVDYAIFATGNPAPLEVPGGRDAARYRPDPWAPETLDGLDPDAPVLLIGTGLTAMDIVLALLDQGHRGPIHALSRRGLLPQPHAPTPMVSTQRGHFPGGLLALMRSLRREAGEARLAGADWRPVVDSIRPATSDLWQVLSDADRRRFLRHLRPWWDTHRHRMAPKIAQRIDAARQHGQLRVQAGRILAVEAGQDTAQVRYRRRTADTDTILDVTRIINCSGPGSDYQKLDDPVVRGLLMQGLARPDALRLGLDVTPNCALRARDGAVSRRLFAIGPLTKGIFWEMVAVPDIRRQCELLAGYLTGLLLSHDSEGSERLPEYNFII